LLFLSGHCSFFFSSRRRHTRFSRDWSSDVCSSDLNSTQAILRSHFNFALLIFSLHGQLLCYLNTGLLIFFALFFLNLFGLRFFRSEERRVGRECRSRWSWGRREELTLNTYREALVD